MTKLRCALTAGDYEWAGVARQRKREEKGPGGMGRGDNVHGPRLRDFCLIIITHEAWYQVICFGDRNYGGMRQNFYCDNFHDDVHLEFSFNC